MVNGEFYVEYSNSKPTHATAAAIGTSMDNLTSIGGLQGLMVVVAFSASLLGMILPVSTPPNSLAYSTGLIESKDMAKVEAILGILGLFITYTGVILMEHDKFKHETLIDSQIQPYGIISYALLE